MTLRHCCPPVIRVDQYPSLQDALNALPTEGGEVYIPANYEEEITAPIVIPYDHIVINNPTCDAVITDGSAGGIVMFDLAGRDYLTFYGFKLTGKGSGNVTVGIRSTGTAEYCVFRRLWFHDCKIGIQAYGGSYVLRYSLIDNCRWSGYALYGIQLFMSCDYNTIINCIANSATIDYFLYLGQYPQGTAVIRCKAFNMRLSGFYCYNTGGALSVPVIFTDCLAYGCGQRGFYLREWSADVPTLLINCQAIRNAYQGFLIQGGTGDTVSAQFHNCVAIDNSRGNANTYAGFHIASSTEYVQLIGCSGFKEWYAEQKYGFEIGVGAVKAEVRGGRWSPNQMTPVNWLNNEPTAIIDVRDD